jgi:hypothetical protein
VPLVIALLVLAIATAMVVVEPFPKGPVLMALTAEHGVDVGDLPAILLYLAAGWIASDEQDQSARIGLPAGPASGLEGKREQAKVLVVLPVQVGTAWFASEALSACLPSSS